MSATTTTKGVSVILDWARNIADNISSGHDPKSELIEAANEIGLKPYEKVGVFQRYNNASQGDYKAEGIYFILTGERHPGPKGYIWN